MDDKQAIETKQQDEKREAARQDAIESDARLLALERLTRGDYHDNEQFEAAVEKLWDEAFNLGYDAASSRWVATSERQPDEPGEYLLKIHGGGYIVRYMQDHLDFQRRDFTHYQRITPPEKEEV